MEDLAPRARWYISAVRRRILIIRLAESIALSIALASIAGLILIPILWYRGQSAVPLAEALIVLGCAVGLIRGISRRPTRLDAAIEADRQLKLHDLLGTVLTLERCQSPADWQISMAALADHRCRSLHPSAIIASRLGLRAWTGVGVLTALLITCALLTTRPTPATADFAAMPEIASNLPAQSYLPTQALGAQSAALSRPPGPGGNDADSPAKFEQDRPDNSALDPVSKKNGPEFSSTGASASSGSGTATTANPSLARKYPQIQTPGDGLANNGHLASGNGVSNSKAKISGENLSTAASGATPKQIAPWASGQSPADATLGNQSNVSGKVPDEDADLIRDYFQHD